MAPRDPNKPQLDFPQLTADIISQLRLTGQVGLIDFMDAIRPVYIVAARQGALSVSVDLPAFESGEVSSGSAFDPAANTIIGDTGPLPSGIYDIWGGISIAGATGVGAAAAVVLQHRDAANAATLATLLQASHTGLAVTSMQAQLPLIGYTLGVNERLRYINLTSSIAGHVGTTIVARLRPTP